VWYRLFTSASLQNKKKLPVSRVINHFTFKYLRECW
jgi:hypothetical protein